MSHTDPNAHSPIGERRHARFVDLPLSARMKNRLGRAIENELLSSSSASTTLRRTMRDVASALRALGFTENDIRDGLALQIQTVALERGLDADSLVSRKPR